jgi:hypothetical protein
MPTEKIPKMPHIFFCEKCDFKCCKNSNWTKHLLTSKHKNLQNPTNKISEKYSCVCGKIYKHSSTYYAHKKKCKGEPDQVDIQSLDMNLIMQLLKQNDEFKSLMIEQNTKLIEAYKTNTSSITTGDINSHNKTFNLNVFLNEQCKDAMNIMDFVDSIKLDLSDLESVGKLGYINGISNIIIKNLKALDVHMRPVHCTDLKRETMYVKSQNTWEKEDEENKNIRRAIKHIAFKNYKTLELFQELHPDCMEYDSKHGDHFLRLRIEALGGGSSNIDYDSHTKIIKKIAKEVTIDKTAT